MALIKCSECRKKISDQASACPNCGNPIGHFEQNLMHHTRNPLSGVTLSGRVFFAVMGLLTLVAVCVSAFSPGRNKGNNSAVPSKRTPTTATQATVASQLAGLTYGDFSESTLTEVTESGAGRVTVGYRAETFWNETGLVEDAIDTDMHVMRALFRCPTVSAVEMKTMVDMTDPYGNTTIEPGVILVYSRATFRKLNWKGFEDTLITDPADALNIADYYRIEPGIYKNVHMDNLHGDSGGWWQK